MHSQPDDVTPAAAVEAYRAHEESRKSRCAAEFFDAHKSDGILADLHRGIHLLRAFDWRIIGARRAADSFAADLRAGAFVGLSLATECREAVWSTVGSGGLGRAALPAGAGEKAPHFLADLAQRSIVFGSVGASLSVWDFHEAFQQKPGFLGVWLGEPAPHSLLRDGRARFESDAQLVAAVEQLAGVAIKGYTMRPVRAPPQESHRVVLAPPAASDPLHVTALNGLAAKVIDALDTAMGLQESETNEVLEAWGREPEAQLDLRALYLRRVHHFCLYSAVWCADEVDLVRRCGAAALRMQGQGWEGEQAWAKEHLQALRRFVGQAADLPRPDPVPACVEGEPLRTRWAAQCEDMMKKEGEGKYRCLKCSKLFKGEDYLQKHILKTHHDGFCRLVLELRDEQMQHTYQEAQTGPGWK